MELFILFGSFVGLLLIGTPVAFCLGIASFATVLYLGLPPHASEEQWRAAVKARQSTEQRAA